MTKFASLIEDFEKIIFRLEEVLLRPKDDIIRDSAVKRFEIAFDLAWKTLKEFLAEEKNAECASPKACFREAYRQGMIEYDNYWITIANLRNETAHSYSEETAEKIYNALPEVVKKFRALLEKMRKEKQLTEGGEVM